MGDVGVVDAIASWPWELAGVGTAEGVEHGAWPMDYADC